MQWFILNDPMDGGIFSTKRMIPKYILMENYSRKSLAQTNK